MTASANTTSVENLNGSGGVVHGGTLPSDAQDALPDTRCGAAIGLPSLARRLTRER